MQLFLASTKLEFRGFLKRCTGVRTESVATVWARSALCRGRRVLLLANGAGVRPAYAAVQAARSRNPAFVCSVGFCGALDPALKIGDIVVPAPARGETSDALSNAAGHTRGALFCSDHVVQTVAEKKTLRDAGFAAVDMESAGAERAARELGVPFHAVKAVSDLANEELRCDYNRALRDDGSIDLMSLSLQALRRPFTCLPDLIRFGRNGTLAAERLGEFLASCEF